MRVLAISSQVAFGPVGNSAAVPALQAFGHEVLALPTVILSHHPGHGRPAALRLPAADLDAMLDSLDELGALDDCDAVMTGYFASDDQIPGIARMIRSMKEHRSTLYVLVDPIIGDGDALYVPRPVAEAIRDHLLPLATCVTPNRFELEWLTGLHARSISEAIAAARKLSAAEVLATSIPAAARQLATLVTSDEAVSQHIAPERAHVPHGTGDFLAGLYLAHRLAHAPAKALMLAMQTLERAMTLSIGSTVLNIAGALHSR